jgi:hypothetical protein
MFTTIICNLEKLRMIQTKNFKPSVDRKLLCTCGHINCDREALTKCIKYGAACS